MEHRRKPMQLQADQRGDRIRSGLNPSPRQSFRRARRCAASNQRSCFVVRPREPWVESIATGFAQRRVMPERGRLSDATRRVAFALSGTAARDGKAGRDEEHSGDCRRKTPDLGRDGGAAVNGIRRPRAARQDGRRSRTGRCRRRCGESAVIGEPRSVDPLALAEGVGPASMIWALSPRGGERRGRP